VGLRSAGRKGPRGRSGSVTSSSPRWRGPHDRSGRAAERGRGRAHSAQRSRKRPRATRSSRAEDEGVDERARRANADTPSRPQRRLEATSTPQACARELSRAHGPRAPRATCSRRRKRVRDLHRVVERRNVSLLFGTLLSARGAAARPPAQADALPPHRGGLACARAPLATAPRLADVRGRTRARAGPGSLAPAGRGCPRSASPSPRRACAAPLAVVRREPAARRALTRGAPPLPASASQLVLR